MAGNLFGGVRDITHYSAELASTSGSVVPLGKTVRLDRAHVTGISLVGGATSSPVGAYLVDAGDGTAQSISFNRYGTSGTVSMRASVVEYY